MRFLVNNEIADTIIGIILLLLAISLGIAAAGKEGAKVLLTIFNSINLPSDWRVGMAIASGFLFLVVMKKAW